MLIPGLWLDWVAAVPLRNQGKESLLTTLVFINMGFHNNSGLLLAEFGYFVAGIAVDSMYKWHIFNSHTLKRKLRYFDNFVSKSVTNISTKWPHFRFCELTFVLTHWSGDKMAAFSQTTLSNAFSWMKILEFRLKIHWILFLRVLLTIFQHRFW